MKKKINLKKAHSIWFTGYPSSGKTTIAKLLIKKLDEYNLPVVNLDGDQIRSLFKNKIYGKKTRLNSVNDYINLVKIVMKTKNLVIVSANHAFKEQRKLARKTFKSKYSEIWISTPIEVCKKRDVKKLYAKAKSGKITNLIGHDLIFDNPINYDLKINTVVNSKKKCVNTIFNFLKRKKIIN